MPSRCQRLLAITLTLTISLFLIPVPALSGTEAQFGGRVFQQDGSTPRVGVVVTLYDTATERAISSPPTDERGFFNIDDAEPGSYAVLAETPEGAYLANDSLALKAGKNKPLALTLSSSATKLAPGASGKGMSKFAKWTIAGAIALAGLFLAADIGDDVVEDTSPSGPL
jgi:hypothetical protein